MILLNLSWNTSLHVHYTIHIKWFIFLNERYVDISTGREAPFGQNNISNVSISSDVHCPHRERECKKPGCVGQCGAATTAFDGTFTTCATFFIFTGRMLLQGLRRRYRTWRMQLSHDLETYLEMVRKWTKLDWNNCGNLSSTCNIKKQIALSPSILRNTPELLGYLKSQLLRMKLYLLFYFMLLQVWKFW